MILVPYSPIFWLAKKMSALLKGSSDTEPKIQEKNLEPSVESKTSETSLTSQKEISKERVKLFYDTSAQKEERSWCEELAKLINEIDLATEKAHSQRGEYFHIGEAFRTTINLSEYVFKSLSELAAQFNDSAHMLKSSNRVKLTITKHNLHELSDQKRAAEVLVSDFRISSATRSLSICCEPGRLYAFLLPANVNLDPKTHETSDRLKLAIILDATGSDWSWTINQLPVSQDEITYLCKTLLRDLVILSSLDYLAYDSGKKFEQVDNSTRIGLARGYKDNLSLNTEIGADLVKDLVFAQQNTVQKLLRQQEEIQSSIARDLHDTVLADIMMLERRLSSESKPDEESLLETLEEISVTIREICQGLVPRDLKDWGLETVLEDLVDKAAERIEADCSFAVENTLPDLPSSVQLHIFRIVQEALNNIEKYAEARNVQVLLNFVDDVFTVEISDDGIGFDTASERNMSSTGGFGLPSINERLEIIRAYYPAKLKFDSKPGEGTKIKLEITIETFK